MPRTLTMKVAGRFIELLGQQMYGGAVPAVAEMIANAWDADAASVEVSIPEDPTAQGAQIVVKDTGRGMTFDELDTFYLTVGSERRRRGETTEGGRLVMGRKGIGKLAGFGIAEDIVVRAVRNGHAVEIVLNYADIRNKEAMAGYVLEPTFDSTTTEANGLTVTFRRLKLRNKVNLNGFWQSMARRFAIRTGVMKITINGVELRQEEITLEFRDPVEGWTEEEIPGVGSVRYWYGFLPQPILDPGLRGLSVFARERIAQVTPFFFNLSGGINGQVGLEYITGQIQADFLDEAEDCIATDRQSVNWQFDRAKGLEQWGQNKIKEACREWKKRRKKEKEDAFRHDYSELNDRIKGLPEQEKTDVLNALDRIADLEDVSKEDFNVISAALLEGVERESVKRVIRRINEVRDDALDELFAAIKEWDVISAVSTAEVVAGRMEILQKFDGHIKEKLPEKAGKGRIDMQTFIKQYPWLLGHEYEKLTSADFHHEHGVDKWIEKVLLEVDEESQSKKADERESRRFDLLCIRDDARIMILELMRPGTPADYDHVMRLNRYVTRVKAAINEKDTREQFRNKSVRGLLIADDLARDTSLSETLNLFSATLDAVTWRGLFDNVTARYREFLGVLKMKAPNDPRLRGLVVPNNLPSKGIPEAPSLCQEPQKILHLGGVTKTAIEDEPPAVGVKSSKSDGETEV